MHILLVHLTVRADMLEAFEQALLHNARESVVREPGCVRFDVGRHRDDPTRWVLYEVYETPDDHRRHRESPHFLAYDRVATRAVVEKQVEVYEGRHVGA